MHPRIGDTDPDRQAYQQDPVVIVTAFSVYMEIYIVQASLDSDSDRIFSVHGDLHCASVT